jgi:hypothetical protein
VKELLGTVCLLQVEYGTSRKGSLFAKVANLMSAPEAPLQVNETFYFSLDPYKFDQAVFDSLPQLRSSAIMLRFRRLAVWRGHGQNP